MIVTCEFVFFLFKNQFSWFLQGKVKLVKSHQVRTPPCLLSSQNSAKHVKKDLSMAPKHESMLELSFLTICNLTF